MNISQNVKQLCKYGAYLVPVAFDTSGRALSVTLLCFSASFGCVPGSPNFGNGALDCSAKDEFDPAKAATQTGLQSLRNKNIQDTSTNILVS